MSHTTFGDKESSKHLLYKNIVHEAQNQTPRQVYYPISNELRNYMSPDHVMGIVTNHRRSVADICTNALVLEFLREKLRANKKILHVGCRTGYMLACMLRIIRSEDKTAKAVLVGLTKQPKTIMEIKQKFYEDDSQFLKTEVINILEGDINQGCPQHAPFDAIFVTASPPRRPNTLISQLAPGGRLIMVVIPLFTEPFLLKFDKHKDGSVVSKRLLSLSHLTEEHSNYYAEQIEYES